MSLLQTLRCCIIPQTFHQTLIDFSSSKMATRHLIWDIFGMKRHDADPHPAPQNSKPSIIPTYILIQDSLKPFEALHEPSQCTENIVTETVFGRFLVVW